ncbi:MAG: thioesterase family protein [Proteobacteria bacterium]|nr:thioesterase family protein [Pseudomonadota bacterium]MBI3497730.1 thioesterase family protein [Pseudomonadota bacterium]
MHGDGDDLLRLHEERVRPEWIDANGHMNVAYYVLAFDNATDTVFNHLGIGTAHRQRTSQAVFVLEAHVTYERELKAGDPMRFTTQLLGVDQKRLHFFHAMYHAEAGFLAATNEVLGLHVDLLQRRSQPFPEPALGRLRQLADRHARLPRPPQAGRVIALKKPGIGTAA